MIPRVIHLNWLDEEPSAVVLASVAYWQANGAGREVVLHSSSSELRHSWQENYAKLALNHYHKSDWMRWSQMLDVGGWYFDIDIHLAPGTSLDDIEASMAPDTCLLVPAVAGKSVLEADILCCPKSWQGSETVDAYFLEHKELFSYFQYSLVLARILYRTHPEWVTIGSANLMRNDWRDKPLPQSDNADALDVSLAQYDPSPGIPDDMHL